MKPQLPAVRVGTYCLVVSPDSRLLLAEQEHKGLVDWGFFGGTLEFGEGIEACALREIREEVRLVRLLAVDENWSGDRLESIGFIFLVEPDPWLQEVRLADQDGGTRFLQHKWATKEEARQLLASPNPDAFWLNLWLTNNPETLIRKR